MRLTRGRVIAAGFAVLITLLLVWAFTPGPVPADSAAVTRGRLEVAIEEEGETRVRDRFVVSAPLPGRMLRIELEPGDPVKARDTVVAQLLPTDPVLLDARTRGELQARVRAAQTNVGTARAERERLAAELEFARRDLKRAEGLWNAGLTSREQLDAASRAVRTLEEALRAADFAIKTAEYQQEVARAGLLQSRGQGRPGTTVSLRSPIDGVLLRRLQESETVVQAGQPLVEVGELTRMEIVSDLLSTDAVRVQPGHRVLIEQWGGDATLGGRVRRVEPSGFMKISALGVEEQRVNVIVDFEDPVAAARRLGDGYRVEVRILIWSKDNVLKVPVSSLFRHEAGWAVFRVENGRAVRRPVRVGPQNGVEAEVLSGLAAGEMVVVYPSDDVRDGVEVVARE